MDLYFAGLGFMESNLFTYSEKLNRLLSFINDKKMIEEFITLLKGEDMDLYLVGPEKDNILKETIDKDNNNMLITYGTPTLIDKELKRRKNNKDKISKLFIDSGAFTAWTRGKKIDIDEYIKFINERSEYIHIYCQLDVIPGEVHRVATKEEGIEAGKKTWENYLYMYPRMKEPQKMLYCFHLGEPLEWFQRALDWRDNLGRPMQYLAIGGIMGKPKDIRIKFLTKIEEMIKNSFNPNIKVHALGMTSFDVLEKFPFITSADSTSWIMTGANGMIMTDYGSIIVSDKQSIDFKHYNNLPSEARKVIDIEINKYGFKIEDLINSRDNRIILNAKYLQDKANNIIYKPLKKNNKLF